MLDGNVSQTATNTAEAQEIEQLIEKRNQARANKDWATADAIRDELKARNIVLEDTPNGVKWHKEEATPTVDTKWIEEMIANRTQAKANKDWATADAIRDELKAKGITLIDTPQGVEWKVE